MQFIDSLMIAVYGCVCINDCHFELQATTSLLGINDRESLDYHLLSLDCNV